LKAERAIHYSAGVEWKPREHINLDVTAFYKDLSHWISTTTATRPDGTPVRFDNNGAGRVYGMEVVARHELTSKFTGWLAYTLSRATRRDSGSTTYRLFEYDQTHILTVFGTYELPRNWRIGSRFRLVSGDPTTPVTGAVYNASTLSYNAIFGAKYSDRLPPFVQLDLRVDKRWIFNRWMLNAYLDLQNVFNRANRRPCSTTTTTPRSRCARDFPFIPSLDCGVNSSASPMDAWCGCAGRPGWRQRASGASPDPGNAARAPGLLDRGRCAQRDFAAQRGGEKRGSYTGNAFSFRVGQLLTERLGLGLLVDTGGSKRAPTRETSSG